MGYRLGKSSITRFYWTRLELIGGRPKKKILRFCSFLFLFIRQGVELGGCIFYLAGWAPASEKEKEEDDSRNLESKLPLVAYLKQLKSAGRWMKNSGRKRIVFSRDFRLKRISECISSILIQVNKGAERLKIGCFLQIIRVDY